MGMKMPPLRGAGPAFRPRLKPPGQTAVSPATGLGRLACRSVSTPSWPVLFLVAAVTAVSGSCSASRPAEGPAPESSAAPAAALSKVGDTDDQRENDLRFVIAQQ